MTPDPVGPDPVGLDPVGPDPVGPDPVGPDPVRLAAIRARDPAADGVFLYAVTTTGVYCHPSCAARPARPEHIRFFATREDAERQNFRPCKRCRPDLPPRAEREAATVEQACRRIEAAEQPPTLAELAADAKLSAFHFHRLFRRVAGVTPKAYADASRARRMTDSLTAGSHITSALFDAGYNSAGRFYDAAGDMLGMKPSVFRAGGPGEVIRHATGHSTLGLVLVAATERGVCAILIGDTEADLLADLSARFPRAARHAADAAFGDLLASAIAHVDGAASPDLPLDIRGTAFQRRVWEILRTIPTGETRSYGEIANQLGQPTGARAVAGACAANPLAVVVPCHRVVAADGRLAGYRWGIQRKRSLLAREQA